MSYLVFDTEVSGAQRNKGNPFDKTNRLMCISFTDGVQIHNWNIEHGQEPYGKKLVDFQERIDKSELLIGFNLKFDLHWVRMYGLKTSHRRLWDCQVFYFIDTGQRFKFPSLDAVCEAYGLPKKLDVVKEEYWNKGLDTNEVPWDILDEYAKYDVELTEKVYLKQLEIYKTKWSFERKRLFSLLMQDLHILEDMEWNGMMFDEEKSKLNGDKLKQELEEISQQINQLSEHPIRISSNDDVSCFLYGGTLKVKERVKYETTLKSGEVKQKERWETVLYPLPKIFEPLKGTELAKEGYYSTDRDTLVKLQQQARDKHRKHVIDLLLRYAKLEKRKGTYYYGIPKKMRALGWEQDELHGSLNQCVVVTGRLSSDSPNLQNIDGECKFLFYSRYKM